MLQKELKELEAKRKKKLELILLGILLSVESEDELISKINLLSNDIRNEIMDMRNESYQIADNHSEQTHKVDNNNRKLIIAAAALYLSSHVIRHVAVSNRATYIVKAKAAIKTSEPLLVRLVSTEIYEANLQKMKSNYKNSDQMFRWSAVNDKRTCAICESLNGKEFKMSEVPAYPHAQCRCYVEQV